MSPDLSNIGLNQNVSYFTQQKPAKMEKPAGTSLPFSGTSALNNRGGDELVFSSKMQPSEPNISEVKKANDTKLANPANNTSNVIQVSRHVSHREAKRIANSMKMFDDTYNAADNEFSGLLSDSAKGNVAGGALGLLS